MEGGNGEDKEGGGGVADVVKEETGLRLAMVGVRQGRRTGEMGSGGGDGF